MTGSLQIKRNVYYMVLNTYKNGKRCPTWISTGLVVKGNKTKAEKLLREKIKEYDLMPAYDDSDAATVSDVIDQWLASVANRVDEVTLQGYTAIANAHIKSYFTESRFDELCFSKITKQNIVDYFDYLYADGRVDGKGGLSVRSLVLVKNVLKQTYDYAIEQGIAHENLCENIKLPKREKFKAKFYTADEVSSLLSKISNEPLYPLIKITALYGLRRSEALGLKWDCIDLNRRLMHIQNTVVKVTHVVEKAKTKTESSCRSYPLSDDVVDMLTAMRKRQAQCKKSFGREYNDNEYVFKWNDGKPFSPDYVSHRFHDLLAKNGLREIRFHDLRHSAASNLLSVGYSLKDVQDWLGHADISTTANIYGHLDMSRKYNMLNAIGDICSEKC